MSGEWIEAGELAELLANVRLDTQRWRRKVQLMLIVGRFGGPRQLSFRELNELTGISFAHLETLLEELIASRMIRLLREGRGSRAAVYAVDPNITFWGRGKDAVPVPWRRELGSIRLAAFHPEVDASASLRALYTREWNASRSGARSSRPERAPESPALHQETQSARRRDAGARSSRLERAQTEVDALVVDPSTGGSGTEPPTTSGLEQQRGEAAHRMAMKRATSALCHAASWHQGKPPYVGKGEPTERLEDLVLTVGVDQLEVWLASSPKGLAVPGMLGWLENQAYLPNAELLAALEARPDPEVPTEADEDQGAEPVVAPEPFTGFHYADEPSSGEIPADARERIAQLRSARPSPPDGTMHQATGGA